MAVYLLRAGTTVWYEIFSITGLAIGATVALGVLVGFARPGALASAEDRSRLEREAHTDNLTGLRNTRAFNEDLARELARAAVSGHTVGLVLLDVDGLKTVNDTQGHQAGDELILAVSTAMRKTLRQGDLAYRIGGDEFAVVLLRETTWGAFRYSQRLQAALTSMPGEIRPRASAGVSASDGHTRDELIREADLALIAAKRGRRGALIFTDDLAVREQGYESHNRANHIDLICVALARAVDERHEAMRGHSEAVSEIAALIGTELGLPPGHVARVRRAGLLHDVGKIAISNAILFKREALDRDELEIMQTHPQIGERIAVGAGLHDEARWVLHHHERPDGRGYPAALNDAEIPLESSIIGVANAYEWLTADRPGCRGCSSLEACDELDREKTAAFRAEVVDALRAVVDREDAGLEMGKKEIVKNL